MLADQLDPAERAVLEGAVSMLHSGPMDGVALVAGLRERGLFGEEVDAGDDEWLLEDLTDILSVTDQFWFASDGSIRLTRSMLDGVVLTHRLTAREIDEDALEIGPDLEMIDYDHDPSDPIRLQGSAVDIEVDMVEGRVSWRLPGGLPPRQRPDDLIALRRDDGQMQLVHPVAEVAPGDAERTALAAELEALRASELGEEATRLVMDVLASSPGSFRSAVPPVSELLAEAGATREGDFFGPGGVEWELPGARYRRLQVEQLALRYEFETCCREAFELVSDAYGDAVMGRDGERDLPTVRSALAHSAVSLAFWDVAGDSPSDVLAPFLDPLTASPRRDAAPAKFLRGRLYERDGDLAAAEAAYRDAILTDDGYLPSFSSMAFIALDRGDLSGAVSHFQRALPEGAEALVGLIRSVAPPVEGVGRNDRCPCGSGRKFKVCHRGQPLLTESTRSRLLLLKADLHLHQERPDIEEDLLDSIDEADLDRLDGDEFVHDVVLFEGGGLEDYVEARGSLLPTEELELARSWLDSERALYEVTAVDEGVSLELLDLSSGERMVLLESSGSKGRRVGEYLLGRLASTAHGTGLHGVVINVPMRGRQSLLGVLDRGAIAEDLIGWYAAMSGAPTIQNRSGHDMVICAVTADTGTDADVAAERLTELFGDPDGGASGEAEASWTWLVELPAGEPVMAATVALAERGVRFETNSVERADELLEMLTDAFPDLTVRDETRTRLDDVPPAEAGADVSGMFDPSDAPPEIQEAVRDQMRRYEEAWLDEHIPALGGMTPREAVSDPTRRDDLLRLLNDDPAGPAGGFGMDTARIKQLLGLGDQA